MKGEPKYFLFSFPYHISISFLSPLNAEIPKTLLYNLTSSMFFTEKITERITEYFLVIFQVLLMYRCSYYFVPVYPIVIFI